MPYAELSKKAMKIDRSNISATPGSRAGSEKMGYGKSRAFKVPKSAPPQKPAKKK